MKWTDEQQKIIDSRGGSLLVSAAAGSGKTAVLIERILQIISDVAHPVDVDRLLVVTFTDAAATEMRTRLYDGIMERIEKNDPASELLRRQLMLLPNAHVSTIHSFCIALMQDYCQELDMDPGFQVGDEGELTLMQDDALKELLEENFEKAEKEFVDLVDMYGEKDTTNKPGLPGIVRNLYQCSRSFEDPAAWFQMTLQAYENSAEETAKMTPYVRKIISLVEDFSMKYQMEKQKRHLIDFNDLERYAYQILVRDGKETDTAKEVQKRFYEIIIDEYQDINRLQDQILKALSKESSGEPNRFMVGDVKQSIYKFRQACPELFLEKYQSYGKGEGDYKRMELDANFRSRTTVTDAVNFVFNQLMTDASCHIDYEDGHALTGKADYPEPAGEIAEKTKLTVFIQDAEQKPGVKMHRAVQAVYVAHEIQDIVENKMVFDKKTGSYRRAHYKDIVILMRTASRLAPLVQQILEAMHIPCFTASKAGFYESREIAFVMNLLRILANPINDIAMAAVMTSPYFHFTYDELTEIKVDTGSSQGNGFYGRMKSYDGPLNEKLREFLKRLEIYREKATELPLSLFLRFVYDDLKLLTFAGTKFNGERRTENLMMLLDQAENFEKTSLSQVYDFVRYVDRKIALEQDMGEANIANENDDVVRIMTIHKSKGLEFPFVFIFNTEKDYIKLDEKGELLLNSQVGFALKNYDVNQRTKQNSDRYEEVKAANMRDMNEEELRLLYVAMTRAREGLYMVGSMKEKDFQEFSAHFNEPTCKLDAAELSEHRNYLKLLLHVYREGCPIALSTYPESDYVEETDLQSGRSRQQNDVMKENLKEQLAMNSADFSTADAKDRTAADGAQQYSEDIAKLEEKYDFDYHYDDWCEIPYTVSVSKLKHQAMEEALNGGHVEPAPMQLIREDETEEETTTNISGASRGTLYHLIFEKLECPEKWDETIAMLLERGLISQEESSIIDKDLILGLYDTEIGKRILKAHKTGHVQKERSFIIGVDPSEVFPKINVASEKSGIVMVQGVIDLYFEEEDGLVIVDYKTDRCENPEILKKRYQKQLDLYERALQMATGKKVKEKWLYAVQTKKEIKL